MGSIIQERLNMELVLPKVSVITPVYNAEKYIREVILSVCNSNYPNIEYVIINDGSTDNSNKVIADAVSTVDREIIFIDSQNQGEATAVNTAYRSISGEFFLIVNADDPIDRNLISSLISAFQKNQHAVVAYPDWKMIDQFGKTISETKLPSYSYKGLIGEFVCLPGPGAMIKKSALQNFLPRGSQFKYVSDFEQWLKLALQGEFVHVPECLATWRNHGQNLSFTDINGQYVTELIQLHKDFFENNNLPPKIQKLRRRSRSYVYYHAASQGINDARLENNGIPVVKYILRSALIFYVPRLKNQMIRRKLLILVVAQSINIYKRMLSRLYRN